MATKAGSEGKRIKYVISGSVKLDDETTLESAQAGIKSILETARAIGDAEAQISVPRLTKVAL